MEWRKKRKEAMAGVGEEDVGVGGGGGGGGGAGAGGGGGQGQAEVALKTKFKRPMFVENGFSYYYEREGKGGVPRQQRRGVVAPGHAVAGAGLRWEHVAPVRGIGAGTGAANAAILRWSAGAQPPPKKNKRSDDNARRVSNALRRRRDMTLGVFLRAIAHATVF